MCEISVPMANLVLALGYVVYRYARIQQTSPKGEAAKQNRKRSHIIVFTLVLIFLLIVFTIVVNLYLHM